MIIKPQIIGTTAAIALRITPIILRRVKLSILITKAKKVATMGIRLYLMILLKSLAQGISRVTGLSISPRIRLLAVGEVQSNDLARNSSDRKGAKKASSKSSKKGFYLGFLIL